MGCGGGTKPAARSTLFQSRMLAPSASAASGPARAGVGRRHGIIGRQDEQAQIRAFRPVQGAAHAFTLDRVLALGIRHRRGERAQAGGVRQRHRPAAEVQMDVDHVARGAGDSRDDSGLIPIQPIDEARFSGVRRPQDRDRQAVAQPLAPTAIGKTGIELGAKRPQLRRQLRDQPAGQALVGKIDLGLGPRPRAQDAQPPRLAARAQAASELPHRLARLALGLRGDQIGERLDLIEGELAAVEGTARELARAGEAKPWPPAQRKPGRGAGASARPTEAAASAPPDGRQSCLGRADPGDCWTTIARSFAFGARTPWKRIK